MKGFSLLEVLIVTVILTILCAIAYPSYASYVTRTRRVEGQVALLNALQQEERYFSQNNRYVAFSASAPVPGFRWWSGPQARSSAYELRADACEGQAIEACVQVVAMPGTARVDSKFADADCATLSLTSAGDHHATGPYERCWP